MPKTGFADESGTDSGCPCYTIGVVLVSAERLGHFEEHFGRLRVAHGVTDELKWTRISRGHGAINFLLDALDFVLHEPDVTFDAIVVRKKVYRNWQGGQAQQETAFYQTYTFLLRHIIRRVRDTAEIAIDDRSDTYPLHHEVVETVGNRMLAQLASTGRLDEVRRVNSHDVIGVQIADLLAGVVNAAHHRHLNAEAPMNAGKLLTIERAAAMLGWDRLCYDTYPHDKFNIWHFPSEYRALPATREPRPTRPVPYVTADDLRRPVT